MTKKWYDDWSYGTGHSKKSLVTNKFWFKFPNMPNGEKEVYMVSKDPRIKLLFDWLECLSWHITNGPK